jgi:hypothetical protein
MRATTKGGFNCVGFIGQKIYVNKWALISEFSNIYNQLQQRLNTLYTINNHTTRTNKMSQTQHEQIVDLIDEHFISNSVMSESDYNSILHYVDLNNLNDSEDYPND